MLSVLLALAVVFTMCITAAVAADTGSGSAATITVETVKNAVQVGDTVTLNVSLQGTRALRLLTLPSSMMQVNWS